jgi:hypothetical protein
MSHNIEIDAGIELKNLETRDFNLINIVPDHCGICLCNICENNEITNTSCNHKFHKECFNEYMKFHIAKPIIRCPICRNSLPNKMYVEKNIEPINFVEINNRAFMQNIHSIIEIFKIALYSTLFIFYCCIIISQLACGIILAYNNPIKNPLSNLDYITNQTLACSILSLVLVILLVLLVITKLSNSGTCVFIFCIYYVLATVARVIISIYGIIMCATYESNREYLNIVIYAMICFCFTIIEFIIIFSLSIYFAVKK